MAPNRRDLEDRIDELRGDGDDEPDEVEQWRAWLREHAEADDRGAGEHVE